MKKKLEKKIKTEKERPLIQLRRNNYILLLFAIIVIIAGFYILSKGDITIAPILLVLGYCVLIPLSLLLRFK